MQNKSNSIVTPETSLKAMVHAMDQALVQLDEAAEHFVVTVLDKQDLAADIKAMEDKAKIRELMDLVENYVLMSGFLIDHPLITVIKEIRDKSKLAETTPMVMAVTANIVEGQLWKHYKGKTYKVTSVAKDANTPQITQIHYTDEMGNTWALPIHQFCRMVEWEGKEVPRFEFIG